MSNDVANCPYCDDGLIAEGDYYCRCDRCGKIMKYSEEYGFESRIENNRYRERIGLDKVKE